MTLTSTPARLFWDQGGLWSLMAWEACSSLGLPLEPITSQEIRQDGLKQARLLLVPGGWPAQKSTVLGPEGREAVRGFVQAGGYYLGFCGGAGLALDVEDGLGLLPLGRAPAGERLASISGPVMCDPGPAGKDHPIWRGMDNPALFHVWWPGQFGRIDPVQVEILARYQAPAPEFCTADLEAAQIEPDDWQDLEDSYGLRLNPASLPGLPAVVQGRFGRGRVMLSYLHFDTLGDANGARALKNLWQDWLGVTPADAPTPLGVPGPIPSKAENIRQQAAALWQKGEELGLWQPRHPLMPLWKRGVRGLEFWSLLRLCRAVCDIGARPSGQTPDLRELEKILAPIWEHGPHVLEAQAAGLQGGAPQAPGRTLEGQWFPRPRRMGGDLRTALKALETFIMQLIRQSPAND